eukprot:scaffold40666_cov19-Tisochrysis_lutea.AAC.2
MMWCTEQHGASSLKAPRKGCSQEQSAAECESKRLICSLETPMLHEWFGLPFPGSPGPGCELLGRCSPSHVLMQLFLLTLGWRVRRAI